MILVTGAGGFVGRTLCAELARTETLRVVGRSAPAPELRAIGIDSFMAADLATYSDWQPAMTGVEIIIHLAARTHVLHEQAADPLGEYRQINVEGTRRLATAAAACGVKRFIYLSSVKVNGEDTSGYPPYTEEAPARPEDAYGQTKWEAEQILHDIARRSDMEFTILRPPLVYGPGVKGNFLRLLRWVARRAPLPLASINNRRSLIFVGNLVHAVTACLRHPAAAGRTYLVSDGEDFSTPDLIRALATALQTEPWLLPCPPPLLKLAAAMLGKSSEMRRLTGSLQVDTHRIRDELDWRPRHTPAEGLEMTARWYDSTLDPPLPK